MNVDNTVSAESTSNITMSDSAESTSNSTMSDSDGIEEEEDDDVWGLIMADWREEAEFHKAILEQALEEQDRERRWWWS